MKSIPSQVSAFAVALACCAVAASGCGKKAEPKGPGGRSPAEETAGDGEHDHGPVVQLGEQAIGTFTVKASRDGEIEASGDAPIDVWVRGGTNKVVSVRFWIGAEDAQGSVKAKAEIEFENEPDHWHSHVEIPDPLPEGSKLWVEVEAEGGAKSVGGFELKG